MKMLMLITKTGRREELEVLLEKEGISGFTEIPNVFGQGTTGLRMGSAAHPDTSSIVFAVVAPDRLRDLIARIRLYCSECHEHLRIMHWDIAVESEPETMR